MRRFVVVGQKALASPEFSLIDLPGTGGRIDVMLRCLRAAFLFSHGLRRDTVVYLVLLGGPLAPRSVRVDGSTVTFLRPDERSMGVLLQKALAHPTRAPEFVTVRPGVAVASGGLQAVLEDLGPGDRLLLDEAGDDLREHAAPLVDPVFFLGDHLGFDDETHARLLALPATRVRIGPISLHTDDALAVVVNELDRRDAAPPA